MVAPAIAVAPSLETQYPQFAQVKVPPFKRAERAWVGTLHPFQSESDVIPVFRGLSNDRAVTIQAGRLRAISSAHAEIGSGLEPYLVNMGVSFTILILEYPGDRHPEAYSLAPEISRQRYPFQPHLREDQTLLWNGRYIQALCTDYAPDLACASVLDLLDYTSLYLAKHLVWLRTRRLVDRLREKVVYLPKPGEKIVDMVQSLRGPEYNVHSAPLRREFPYPFQERFGWCGVWPGSEAPHDSLWNLQLEDNSSCHCGSGERYFKCHKEWDRRSVDQMIRSLPWYSAVAE